MFRSETKARESAAKNSSVCEMQQMHGLSVRGTIYDYPLTHVD